MILPCLARAFSHAAAAIAWVATVAGAVLILFVVLALPMLRPGWSEAAILGGLGACLALAVALALNLGRGGDDPTRPA